MRTKLHPFPMRRACSSIYHLRRRPPYLPIQTRILRNRSLDLFVSASGEVVVYGLTAGIRHAGPCDERAREGLLPRIQMKNKLKTRKRSSG